MDYAGQEHAEQYRALAQLPVPSGPKDAKLPTADPLPSCPTNVELLSEEETKQALPKVVLNAWINKINPKKKAQKTNICICTNDASETIHADCITEFSNRKTKEAMTKDRRQKKRTLRKHNDEQTLGSAQSTKQRARQSQ